MEKFTRPYYDSEYDDSEYDDSEYDDAPESEVFHTLEPPRHRQMNNDSTDDFVAVDFETMTGLRTSACAVGMVRVIDGEIAAQYYSLINPVRDEYTDREPNINIHGIPLKTVEKAETFAEIFETMRQFIGGLPLVCHNKGVDIVIIDRLMDYYGLSGIKTSDAICTYQMTGMSLEKCCKEFGIKLSDHHNALADAEACAKIYLHLIGKPWIQRGSGSFIPPKRAGSRRTIDKEHRKKLDPEAIENKDTIFFNANVVITGVFKSFPDRDDLAMRIQNLGAKVNGAISKRTTHVVVGTGAGPKKIEKIKELQEAGIPIAIIREHDLIKILT